MTLALANVSAAFAQDYPSRPITIVVPFAAGGAADGISKHIGQPVVVENIGSRRRNGLLRMKSARPDGYTIGLGSMGTHAAAVQVNPHLAYDPRTDFDYLGLVSTTPNALFVRKDFPANTLKEYIAYAKAMGRTSSSDTSGIGSAPTHHHRVPVATDRGRADDGFVPGLRSNDQ